MNHWPIDTFFLRSYDLSKTDYKLGKRSYLFLRTFWSCYWL